MLPGFPVIMTRTGASFATMVAANIVSEAAGYIRSGSSLASSIGSGGSLTASLLPGQITDAVVSDASAGYLYFAGDRVSLLQGLTGISINGTNYVFSGPPEYVSDSAVTFLIFGFTFSAGASYALAVY